MMNVIHRKIYVNDGFGVLKVVTSTQDTEKDKEHGKPHKKFEDVELQALLDEDDSQTQNRLAEQLGVDQQAVFNRLREMGKIQNTNRWVPQELNARQMEKLSPKTRVTFCSLGIKGSRFCII